MKKENQSAVGKGSLSPIHKNNDLDKSPVKDIYTDGKEYIYETLTKELENINQMFVAKFDLYEAISDANDDTDNDISTIDSSKIRMAQYEMKYKKMMEERAKQTQAFSLPKNSSSKKRTVESINDIRNQIGNNVLELEALKEKNIRDEQAIDELKTLLNDLEESIEFSESEFSTNCLEKFDQILTSDSFLKGNMNANEVYKSLITLLKQVEKEYEFNAIDPVDEERDNTEIKHKLVSFEKAKHEMSPLLQSENQLSQHEKDLFDQIQNIKNLGDLKRIEDRVIKLLKPKEDLREELIDAFDKSTIELSSSYYKKAIVRSRSSLVDIQTEFIEREQALNLKTNDFYSNNLLELEAKIKQNSNDSV